MLAPSLVGSSLSSTGKRRGNFRRSGNIGKGKIHTSLSGVSFAIGSIASFE
jgi:hypothetical protein